tara:strand:+ start:1950 stop:2648 length:699 start_codon:yes stop_codon:yes gene_type:complete
MKFKLLVIIFIMTFFSKNIGAETVVYKGDYSGLGYEFTQTDIGKNSSYFTSNPNDYEVVYFFNFQCPTCTKIFPYINLWNSQFKRENTNIYSIPVQIKEGDFLSMDLFLLMRVFDISFSNMVEGYNVFLEMDDDYNKDDYNKKIEEKFGIGIEDINDARNRLKYVDGKSYLEKINKKFDVKRTPTIYVLNRNYIYEIDVSKLKSGIELISSINQIHNIKIDHSEKKISPSKN